jgi:hypothetical protein
MATFQELASAYLSRLQAARDKQAEIQRIISEINGLAYSDTKRPLSPEDKGLLAENIKAAAVRAASNEEFLKLIEIVKNEVKK